VADDHIRLGTPANPYPLVVSGEVSRADQIRGLMGQAKSLARDHVKALSRAMVELEQLAAEIADGGDAYAPGIREIARQLVEDLDSRVQTLEAIAARTP
jgi:hypothetical protein